MPSDISRPDSCARPFISTLRPTRRSHQPSPTYLGPSSVNRGLFAVLLRLHNTVRYHSSPSGSGSTNRIKFMPHRASQPRTNSEEVAIAQVPFIIHCFTGRNLPALELHGDNDYYPLAIVYPSHIRLTSDACSGEQRLSGLADWSTRTVASSGVVHRISHVGVALQLLWSLLRCPLRFEPLSNEPQQPRLCRIQLLLVRPGLCHCHGIRIIPC